MGDIILTKVLNVFLCHIRVFLRLSRSNFSRIYILIEFFPILFVVYLADLIINGKILHISSYTSYQEHLKLL